MKFCPNCGKENPDDRSFCLYCRKSLRLYRSEAKAPVTAPKEPPVVKESVPIEPHKSDSKLLRHDSEPVWSAPEPVLRTPEPVMRAPEPARRTPEPVRSTPEPVRTAATPVWTDPAPVRPAKVKRPAPRISAMRELKLLLKEGFMILVGEPRNLLISLLFTTIHIRCTMFRRH